MKLDRLLAITMLLINRSRISAADLARQFEVSPRTIYRDIEAISLAGLPVVAYQGKGGGFGIMESYRIDRQVLTVGEMQSLLIALKGVGRAVADRKMDGLAEKIETLIPSEDKAAARKQKRVFIDISPWIGRRSEQEKIRLINEAMDRGRLLTFAYTNAKGETSTRQVEPMAIILKEYLRYLYGFCRLRQDYRLFRLSRMVQLRLCDEGFARREMNLDDYSWQSWPGDEPTIEVEFSFSPAARVRVLDYFEPEQICPGENGRLLVKGTYPDNDWLYEMILSHGEEVEVISPDHVRERIKARAAAILRLYQGS